MRLKKFLIFETKRFLGKRYLSIALIFLLASGYFIQYGIVQYKHILTERDNFVKFEFDTYKQFVYPAMYGVHGLELFFEPSPLMAQFDSGVPIPPIMTSLFNGSERMKIYHSLKGQGGFVMISSSFMTMSGFILLLGSGIVLLYGFFGTKDHEWLELLDGSTSRKKLFSYLLISKAFILLLFCLALAALSFLLFLINGVFVNAGQVFINSLVAFSMLLCFLFFGFGAGTLKNRFWRWQSMVIAWFVLAFVIPVFLYHWTYGRATFIQSPYKVEAANQKLFTAYERSSLEKGGKFNQSKRGSDLEKEMFLDFWEGGLKEAIENESEMINEMKDNATFFQNLAAIFPTTFFLSVNNEMSSRGFDNLAGFYEYTIKKKKEYIWYLAQNYIMSAKMVFPPFIKGNENIYHGISVLPGNFKFGISVSLVWMLLLLWYCFIVFNRMLDRAQETSRDLGPKEIKKNRTTVIFTSDRGILPRLIAKLKFEKIPYVSVPFTSGIPGDSRVKNLFSLFDMAVPEALLPIAGKYVSTLDPDDRGKVLAEITGSFKCDFFIFNNFLTGLSDDFIKYFSGVLARIKKGNSVVYFTNSLKVTTEIADHVIKWNNEKQPF